MVERTKYNNNALDIIIENINRIAQGKVPVNLVDKNTNTEMGFETGFHFQ